MLADEQPRRKKWKSALSDDSRVYEVTIGSYLNPDQLCVVSCASDRQADAFMLAFQRAVEDHSIDVNFHGRSDLLHLVCEIGILVLHLLGREPEKCPKLQETISAA